MVNFKSPVYASHLHRLPPKSRILVGGRVYTIKKASRNHKKLYFPVETYEGPCLSLFFTDLIRIGPPLLTAQELL